MIFNKYASYYDLMYADKDYSNEVEYISSLINKFGLKGNSILDLGCGTGRHDILLAKKGYKVIGTDKSMDMINHAKNKIQNFNGVDFIVGDAINLNLSRSFSNVISLFHVAGYIGNNEAFLKYLKVAYRHLIPKGLFIFDFWYGPGVLTEKPSVRVKRMENEKIIVRRIAEPTLLPTENKVVIDYEVLITDKEKNETLFINEKHEVRYFFYNEIQYMLELQGFKPHCFYKWLTFSEPDCNTWYVVVVAIKK